MGITPIAAPAPTPNLKATMPTSPLAYMPVHVLRNFLFDIADRPGAGTFPVDCGSSGEAQKLRSRLNKIRGADRREALRAFAAAGMTLDRTKGESPLDWLVFQVEGATLNIIKSGMTKADLYAMAGIADMLSPDDRREGPSTPAPAQALPALRGDGDGQGVPGQYDTAPHNDEDPFL